MPTEQELNQKYELKPGQCQRVLDNFDWNFKYGNLHKLGKQEYKPSETPPKQKLDGHASMFRETLAQADIDHFCGFFKNYKRGSILGSDALPLIQKILNPEIDAAIKDYFKSNYAVIWQGWGIVKWPDKPEAYSNKWHCDGGPTQHIKTITYLNSTAEHGSSTAVASFETTNKFKEIGYVMNDIRKRQIDVSDLCEHFDIKFDYKLMEFNAGDTLVFNPTMRMHRIELPKPESTRYCFTLCIVPCPMDWQELAKSGFYPDDGCFPFDRYANDLLNVYEKQNQNTPFPKEKNKDEKRIMGLEPSCQITSEESLREHLTYIFGKGNFAENLIQMILKSNNGQFNFSTYDLVKELKNSFARELDWNSFFSQANLNNVQALLRFEERFLEAQKRHAHTESNSFATAHWPSSNTAESFNSPGVSRFPFIEKSTPIAVAGSKFIARLANSLVEKKYSVILPSNNSETESQEANFSANFGTIDNCALLAQLSNIAFQPEAFTTYYQPYPNGMIRDIYRDGIMFTSLKNFCYDASNLSVSLENMFRNAKVMLVGLNSSECWKMHDGSVLAGEPNNGLYQFLQHTNLNVHDNIEYIKQFVGSVRRYNPEFKLILCISPEPIQATGNIDTQHVAEANNLGKSTLRVAFEEASETIEGVYYFPLQELKYYGNDTDDEENFVRNAVKLFEQRFAL